MFKKTNKSLENRYGLIDTLSNFPRKPCILGIVPSSNERMLNGYMNLFMYMLQIRRFDDVNSYYDIDNVPFDLLMANDDKIDSIIINSIPNNIDEAKKLLRNINIISYCDGNNKTGYFLRTLYQELLNKGFDEEEVKELLSQIFVLQIVDNYYDGKANSELPFATVVTVHDIYDFENTDYYFEEEKESMFQDNPFVHVKSNNENDRYVIYKSFGEGSLADRQSEHIFERDYAKAPIINYIMSLYLIKALHMSIYNIEIRDNISIKDEIDKLIEKVGEFIKKKNKNYNDFTKEELMELNELLMPEIQSYFKNNIPVRLLDPKEKNELDEHDYVISEFYKLNAYLGINQLIGNINVKVAKIIEIDNNYQDNDIAYTETNNYGVFEYKKEEAIKVIANQLAKCFSDFMNIINGIKIPDNISENELHKVKEYISSLLNKAKSSIINDKFLEIINTYCDNETKSKLGL